MNDFRYDDSARTPMSNGPIRIVTAPALPKYILDSDRREMEYLLPFPFYAVDPYPWPPIQFFTSGVPITINRPIGVNTKHGTDAQMGNEEADAYLTIVRLSTPTSFHVSAEDGWIVVKRMLEWIRVKCRHYWLLHGTTGFGATYRGTLFVKEGRQFSQQNQAMYGPSVIVNPLTLDVWLTLAMELENEAELPLEDSIYCDSLLSIVAGDTMKAFLEAGVAMEVSLTRLLVEASTTGLPTAAKADFIRLNADRAPFGKKLREWTTKLGLQQIETFRFDGMPPRWHETVLKVYKLRNDVAHGGKASITGDLLLKGMFAAGALLEYCRAQRVYLGLGAFSMPAHVSPWHQVKLCHDAYISASSATLSAMLG